MNQSNSANFLNTSDSASPVLHDAMGNPFTIRLATVNDLPKIVDTYNQSVLTKQATADLEPVTVADRIDWFESHKQRKNRPIYVAENTESKLIAWCSFNDFKSRPAYNLSSEISIYVDNQFYKRNIASLMLAWMLSQAASLGIQNTVALIFSHNAGSIRLFEKHGFENWGVLPNICNMGDFLADVIIMGKQTL